MVKVVVSHYRREGDSRKVYEYPDATHFQLDYGPRPDGCSPVLIVRSNTKPIAAYNSWDAVEVV